MKRRLVLVGLILVPALVTLGALIAGVMAFSLRGSVDTLTQEALSTRKAQKVLRAEVASVGDDLDATEKRWRAEAKAEAEAAAAALALAQAEAESAPVVAADPVARPAARAMRVQAVKVGFTRPTRTEPLVPMPECVFKPGDPEGLRDCIRSRQDQLAKASAQFLVR